MAGNADAAQDISTHTLDLHSPEKVATASQVRHGPTIKLCASS